MNQDYAELHIEDLAVLINDGPFKPCSLHMFLSVTQSGALSISMQNATQET